MSRRRLLVRRVRASVRLGECERPNRPTVGQPAEPLGPLRVGAELGHHFGDQRVVDGQDDPDRRAGVGHRLDGQRVADVVPTAAAELRRHGQSHQSKGTSLRDDLVWKPVAVVDPRRFRSDHPLGELPHSLAERLLLVGELDTHGPVLRAEQLLEDRFETRRRGTRCLRHDACLGGNRHEVRVAVPARHEMHVQVPDCPRARSTPDVDPDIETVRIVGLGQCHLGGARQGCELAELVVVYLGQRPDVTDRDHHQVAVVIRKFVEDHKAR